MRSLTFALAAITISILASCEADVPPAASIPASTSTSGSSALIEPNATVDYIVDGDTIDVIIDGTKERVRLTGIDTPEAARRDTGAPAECFADEATAYIQSLLPVGALVRLERDVVGRDDYGRLLAYIYRADDGIFVNYELIRQGYAQPLSIAPNVAFSELMVEAARDAEADDAGLWSACS